ncbi:MULTISPECIES: hypothetical protein [Paenibacillus]|uniref:Uncharacterized protein n=1 Tax=Paenibacillus agricola TaxID=2716264 RepID=A0ABX0JLD6_9BACL|nr:MULTISPECIES: hypothetical protein [Paenibacillus]MCY9669561.1 hypothetical protein [Paenibacillus alginolyticus]NHN35006.1 hypothetical protein [Paenibacillus agricola]
MYNPKPVFIKDNDSCTRQMYEWYLQMTEQLRSFHLDKAAYFRKIIKKTKSDFYEYFRDDFVVFMK